MKIKSTNRFLGLLRRFFGTSAIVVSLFGLAKADTFTWTDLFDGNWSNSSLWENSAIADGEGNTAAFTSDIINDPTTVTLDSSRTIGHLVFPMEHSSAAPHKSRARAARAPLACSSMAATTVKSRPLRRLTPLAVPWPAAMQP